MLIIISSQGVDNKLRPLGEWKDLKPHYLNLLAGRWQAVTVRSSSANQYHFNLDRLTKHRYTISV